MSLPPFSSVRISRLILLGTFLPLAFTSGSAQQGFEYKSLQLPGRPPQVVPAVLPEAFPLPWALHASERPERPTAVEEAWTPSVYRVSGTTFLVMNTNDAGAGSLRQAILDANANPGQDIIAFLISGTGVQTISPLSELPVITDPVIIDGATQSGYAGTPLIEIDGSGAGIGKNGLVIRAGGSIVRALVINRFVANASGSVIMNGMGILLDNAGGNVIEGCYIGLKATGTDTLGNGGTGIGIFGGSSHNLIGGYGLAARNIISGNKVSGIQVSTGSTGGNRIINNYIGLNAAGDASLGNLGNGIFIDAPDDTIGGTTASARNLISGNGEPGLALASAAQRTLVQGNYFGTDWGYWSGFGNGYNGVLILGGSYNTIGGPGKAAQNLIYASNQAGILIDSSTATGNVVQGNYVGGLLTNGPATANVIGIWIRNAHGNTIGGTSDSVGNLVTFNFKHGIEISGTSASGNIVQGNKIGGYSFILSPAGNGRYGVVIDDAPGNLIGGTAPNAPNFIQGNQGGGIIIAGTNATRNIVQGNCIGPDINRAKGNGIQPDGIIIAASGNLIGGTLPYQGNIIAYNKGCGIFDSTGSRNTFLSNLIYSNDSLGIDLGPRGITPNDSLDADAGANNLQNFPILDSADIGAGSVRIRGRMSGAPGAVYSLEFFTNDWPSAHHVGQGAKYLGEGSVTCDGAGNGVIDITIPESISINQFITATATGPDSSTSEFARELCMLDTDGDGILDWWETAGDGIDWNCDGKIDLDLYRMGARASHKDVFVEVDYMVGREPKAQSLSEVRTTFQSVPNKYLNNPDGMNGINLVVDFDTKSTAIPHEDLDEDPWQQFLAAKAAHFGTDQERRDSNWVNIREAKWLVYRYCIFADKWAGGQTGFNRGDLWGPTNDFFVSLAEIPTLLGHQVMFESATFMHELGHTLGLRHGGAGDTTNYKPNYYSVMNYLYLYDVQSPPAGYVIPAHTWRLNYSPAPLATLNENSLDESIGLDPPPGEYDVVEIPYSQNAKIATGVLKPGTAVDWDGNLDSTGMAQGPVDLNVFPPLRGASPGETLTSSADWPNLKYNFRDNGLYQIRNEPPQPMALLRPSGTKDHVYDEPTMQVYIELQKLPPFGVTERMSSWSHSSLENMPVSTDQTGNYYPNIVGDGRRGALVSWHHVQPTYSPVSDMTGVYVQRLDSMGQTHWQNDGVWISPGRPLGGTHAIASDGAGGAILAWNVSVDPISPTSPLNMYAQRIDSDGTRLWGEAGVAVSTNGTTYGGQPMIVSDGAGGAIIAWETTPSHISAQRLDGNGVPLWSVGGIRLGTDAEPSAWWGELGSAIAHDPAGGTVVIWMAYSTTGSTIVHAQRIDDNGSIRWGTNGLALSTTGATAFLLPVGGGEVVIAWPDNRTGTEAIFAQRLDTSGAALWGSTGLAVDVSSRHKYGPRLVADGKGGVIVSWFDTRTYPPYPGVYGQRISSAGSLVWPSSVSFADSASVYGGSYGLVSDLKGGALLIFSSSMRSSYPDIFVQHIDSSGTPLWSGNGVAVSMAPYNQTWPVAVGDEAGGAIAAWTDERFGPNGSGSPSSIFAQLVNRTGGLGGTLVTAIGSQGPALPESFRLLQNYPNPFNPSTTIEYDLPSQSKVVVRIYDVLGRLVEEVRNDIEPAGHMKLRWSPQNRFASGVYFCRVQVTGTGGGGEARSRVLKMLLIR